MYNFLLNFFGLKKLPRLSAHGRDIYNIDPKFEDLIPKKPDFSPVRTRYRMTNEEFEEVISTIHLHSSGFFVLTRTLRLLSTSLTIALFVYLILYFTVLNNPPLYLAISVIVWIIAQIIIRVFRMKILKKAEHVIDYQLQEINVKKYHKLGLHWRITSYAQFLELNLNYSNPYSFELTIKPRMLSRSSSRCQGSPTSQINASTPLLSMNLSMASPKRGSNARSTKSNYSRDQAKY
jgi:type IV secretory pathway VirB3-like protein